MTAGPKFVTRRIFDRHWRQRQRQPRSRYGEGHMRNSNRQPGRTSPMETFRHRRNELEELVALSQSAAQLLRSRALSSYTRLSELLDEVLPVEPDRETRLARSISLDLRELR